MNNTGFFRNLRLLLLLALLLFVALDAWYDRHRTTSWDRPLVVMVYPLNADGSTRVADHITALERDHFSAIEAFFAREAQRWNLSLADPVEVHLTHGVRGLPPLPPEDGGVLQVMWWSLKLRWWTFRVTGNEVLTPHVRLFALYHDPARTPSLPHSTGLRKGLVGIAHLFADARAAGSNHVVLAHELLHTLGATDKYDPRTNLPLYPLGYAEPERAPLLPQRHAELMAGRIPVSRHKAVQPDGLGRVLIGEATAREIIWLE